MTGFIQRTFAEILNDVDVISTTASQFAGQKITGIEYDSRKIQPGNVFVALQGGTVDAHQYIPAAVERGAAAVVGMRPGMGGLPVPYLLVKDSRLALAQLSAAFYNHPARQMTVIGVTGTDGKTTTSNLIYNILTAASIPVGMISTVSARIGNEELDTGFHVTTPEAPDVQRYLARMLAAGLTHVVLESTSHGLAQRRVACCDFDIGVVTNITHEHLDYHGTYEAYRAAKGRLFEMLAETPRKKHGNPRMGILNRDDISYPFLKEITKVRQVTYSLEPGVEMWAEDIRYNHAGIHFTLRGKGISQKIESHLVGAYNVSNCLAALSTAILGLGIDPELAARGIGGLKAVPGRMESIDLGQDFMAIVDFAHTPNALKRALEAARQMTDGKVIAVFGSAGLRDRQKRRMMAEESIQQADYSILTAEDPRTESLAEILEEMASAAVQVGGRERENFWRVPDRREAIRFALSLAKKGDIILCCGKGHEQSMCFGAIEYPWDDRVALQAALAEKLGKDGPAMPFLPEPAE